MRIWMLTLLAAPLAVGQVRSLPTAQYVSNRSIVLTFRSDSERPISRIRLFVSRDSGRTWGEARFRRAGPGSIRFCAETDGRYGFYLVLENEAGASSPPPGSGTLPHVQLVVDTAPPTVQLHAARIVTTERGQGLRFSVTLIEENLGPEGVRLFYRDDEDRGWTDGGPVSLEDGELFWSPPRVLSGPFDVRVAVTDLGGNRAFDELSGLRPTNEPVRNRNEEPDADDDRDAPATQPAQTQVETAKATGVAPAEVTHEGLQLAADVSGVAGSTSETPDPQIDPAALALRKRAARFMSEGRYALAAARLREALELAPDDANLLTELGGALFHSRRLDEAGQVFQSALEGANDNQAALEGLALVEVTRRRYPQARELLKRLVELEPDSAKFWLRYGDVEHRLGNTSQAVEAWQRVLRLEKADRDLRERARRRLSYFGSQQSEPRP